MSFQAQSTYTSKHIQLTKPRILHTTTPHDFDTNESLQGLYYKEKEKAEKAKNYPPLIPAHGRMSLCTRWCSWPREIFKLHTCKLGGFHIGALRCLIIFSNKLRK